YQIITTPNSIVQQIRYHCFEIYNLSGDQISLIRHLEAVSDPNHGWNTIHGRDSGPPPPYTEPPQSESTNTQQEPNPMAGRGYNTMHGFDQGPPPPSFTPNQGFGIPQYPAFFPAQAPPQAYGFPAPAMQVPVAAAPQMPQYGYGYGYGHGYPYPGQTHPAPPPRANPAFPGIHLRNHTGGVGLPPGYDYAFPQAHCKIHVFTTKTPPWQYTTVLHSWDETTHVKMYVPATTTVKDLMQGLGCTNAVAGKNVLYEVTEAGNGKWLKGLTIAGDDKDKVKVPISEMGWDMTRTGHPGERPVVWLYFTKD
ncbi:hypothetical protein LHYA1_G008062, partial [Lachnellula hyalina]